MQVSTVDFTDTQGLLEAMDEEVHFSLGQYEKIESDDSGILWTDDQQISADFAVMGETKNQDSQMSSQAQEPQVGDDPPAWNLKGHAHLEAGRYDDAIAAYIRAIELSHGTNWSYINNLTLAYRQKDGASLETTGDDDEPEPGSRASEDLLGEFDKLPSLFYTDPPMSVADAPADVTIPESRR
jgi:tetratricopeptide (TPR) repeat protein